MSATKLISRALYAHRQQSTLSLSGDTIMVRYDDGTSVRFPLSGLDSIVAIGVVHITPDLIGRAIEDRVEIAWVSAAGRFRGRIDGGRADGVLSRHRQHLRADDPAFCLALTKVIIATKVANSRALLMRAARDADSSVAKSLSVICQRLQSIPDQISVAASLDEIRGIEGMAARSYFNGLDEMLPPGAAWRIGENRSRRPPLNEINAALSFGYALLVSSCAGAMSAAGLDPTVGVLHSIRSGRPAGALDIAEELRAPFVDRLVATLINRRQLTTRDFEHQRGGAVLLNERGRNTFLIAWQERRSRSTYHLAASETVPASVVPHLQARSLAAVYRDSSRRYYGWAWKA